MNLTPFLFAIGLCATSLQCVVWLAVGVLLARYLIVRIQLVQRVRDE